jgi:hypothetical protein
MRGGDQMIPGRLLSLTHRNVGGSLPCLFFHSWRFP